MEREPQDTNLNDVRDPMSDAAPSENSVAPGRPPVRSEPNTAGTSQPPQAESGTAPEETDAREGPLSDEAAGPRPASAVPRAVAELFLRVDNEYYFPDRTLAFIDHGDKLTARTNNAEVVRSLVAIAEARGWTSIRVKGASEFRRQVWREAMLRGVDVRGYDASDVEREEVRRAIERQRGDVGRQSDAPAPAYSPGDPEAPAGAPRAPTTRIKGHLVEAGPAPYKFDPKNGLSYYVKLHTDEGERVLWGVDLERALAESSSRVAHGDEVIVQSTGTRPVTIKVPKHDAAGRSMGVQSIQTHRKGWLIEKPAYFEQCAERAAAFRRDTGDGPAAPQDDAALAKARLGLWLGERFAAAQIANVADRTRFMAFLKDALAQALERGHDMPSPKLTPEAEARLRRAQQERAAHAAPAAPTWAEREREEPPHARA